MDDDRGHELVDIALRLMAAQGFEGTSIAQIAATAARWTSEVDSTPMSTPESQTA